MKIEVLSPVNEKKVHSWSQAALFFFVISMAIGAFLRSLHVWPQDLNYKFILYSHTHVILSGWVYAALFILLSERFLSPASLNKPSLNTHYWLTQLGVVGMMIAFPIQGYKLYSIACSTLVILLSYLFVFRVWREATPLVQNSKLGFKTLKMAFMLMLIASCGPWSLGPLMVKMPGSELYKLAVYFYLHFQYNGFFSFAIFAWTIRWLEAKNVPITCDLKAFVYLMFTAVFPAYLLSALWLQPPIWIYALSLGAVLAQLIALAYLFKYIFIQKAALLEAIAPSSAWVKRLWAGALLAFTIKLALQALTAIPYFADLAYQYRDFIIAYLHLTFLGFVSCFLLGALIQRGLIQAVSRRVNWGFILFALGLLGSETLLVYHGSSLWLKWAIVLPFYYQALFAFSSAMPVGILLIFLSKKKTPLN